MTGGAIFPSARALLHRATVREVPSVADRETTKELLSPPRMMPQELGLVTVSILAALALWWWPYFLKGWMPFSEWGYGLIWGLKSKNFSPRSHKIIDTRNPPTHMWYATGHGDELSI